MNDRTKLGASAANDTKETTAPVFWMHHVLAASAAMGVGQDFANEQRPRLVMWFQAGEPARMAASSLGDLHRSRSLCDRADLDRAVLRAAFRASGTRSARGET